MRIRRISLLVAAIMIFGAVSASAAGSNLSTNIGITDSYMDGDVTIIVYTEGDFENISNNVLLKDSFINGNLKIQIVANDGSAPDNGRWQPFFEETDFRGEFAPKLY